VSFDVAVVGSLHLDIMIFGSPLPARDETVFGKRWDFQCGGKGGNQAVAAARLGASVQFIGAVGDDEFGRTLTRNLLSHGIDIAGVAVHPHLKSGMSAAIADDAGDYGASVVSGANQAIDVTTASAIDAKVLLLQNEVNEAANLAALRAAKQKGIRTVFNAAPWRKPLAGLIDAVDMFVLNRVEAEQAGHLLDGLTRLLTRGGEGLTIIAGGKRHDIAAHAVPVRTTHGAGDCFCGALAAELSRGTGLIDAAHFANAAAALFVAGEKVEESAVRRMVLNAK
jgi:ribokinase